MLNFDHTSNNISASSGNVSINGIVPGAGGGGGGLTPTTTIKIADYTAVASDLVLCNTTGGTFTVKLPSSPSNGTSVGVTDTTNSFATNNLIVDPNGSSIDGNATTLLIDINGAYVSFVYNTIATSWKIQTSPLSYSSSNVSSSGTLSGILKGSGSTVSNAIVGTDYSVGTSLLSTGLLKSTTITGALSIANPGTDFLAPNGALGTPSSGTLTNCTVDGTNGVGYVNIPMNSQIADYTLTLTDAGKCILHPSSDATARTFTINGSLAYPIGTALSFTNMSTQVITISITTDTMYLAGATTATTGSRTLMIYGSATALKVAAGTWLISGAGLV